MVTTSGKTPAANSTGGKAPKKAVKTAPGGKDKDGEGDKKKKKKKRHET